MKALTICQPYAELIARGDKVIENRTWFTSYRGRLAIHAGRSRSWLSPGDELEYPSMVFGAVVAVATLYDCVRLIKLPPELQGNPHANGPWCWLLKDMRRVHPDPVRGAMGLWDYDE